jgi:hypothetical protein
MVVLFVGESDLAADEQLWPVLAARRHINDEEVLIDLRCRVAGDDRPQSKIAKRSPRHAGIGPLGRPARATLGPVKRAAQSVNFDRGFGWHRVEDVIDYVGDQSVPRMHVWSRPTAWGRERVRDRHPEPGQHEADEVEQQSRP